MSLDKALALTRGQVPVEGGDPIPVYGLSVADIVSLVDRHQDVANGLFNQLSGDQGDDTLSDTKALAAQAVKQAPSLVAEVIALATGEPDKADVAAKLPAGLQIKLVEEIIRRTTFVAGGLGELVETVIAAMGGATDVVRKISDVPR